MNHNTLGTLGQAPGRPVPGLPADQRRYNAIDALLNMKSRKDLRLRNAQLGPDDILCGRNKKAFNNPGNKKLRMYVTQALPQYLAAPDRPARLNIITGIYHTVIARGGFFLKPTKDGKFEEMEMEDALEKIRHAIRDAKAVARNEKKKEEELQALLAAGKDPKTSELFKKRRKRRQGAIYTMKGEIDILLGKTGTSDVARSARIEEALESPYPAPKRSKFDDAKLVASSRFAEPPKLEASAQMSGKPLAPSPLRVGVGNQQAAKFQSPERTGGLIAGSSRVKYSLPTQQVRDSLPPTTNAGGRETETRASAPKDAMLLLAAQASAMAEEIEKPKASGNTSDSKHNPQTSEDKTEGPKTVPISAGGEAKNASVAAYLISDAQSTNATVEKERQAIPTVPGREQEEAGQFADASSIVKNPVVSATAGSESQLAAYLTAQRASEQAIIRSQINPVINNSIAELAATLQKRDHPSLGPQAASPQLRAFAVSKAAEMPGNVQVQFSPHLPGCAIFVVPMTRPGTAEHDQAQMLQQEIVAQESAARAALAQHYLHRPPPTAGSVLVAGAPNGVPAHLQQLYAVHPPIFPSSVSPRLHPSVQGVLHPAAAHAAAWYQQPRTSGR